MIRALYCTFIRSRWGWRIRSSSTSTALRPISFTGCTMVRRRGSFSTMEGLRFRASICSCFSWRFCRRMALLMNPAVCSLLMA